MPSAVRQVGFAPVPATYSRLPHDDELYVMKAFARHCSHCSTCAHPYDVHRRGGTLCSNGLQRAQDVAQYVFNKAGQAFSVVDLDGNKRIQVEIPADCSAVRELLKAMERGLHLRRKAPTASYDETYYVPARRSAHHDIEYRQPRPQQQQPRYTHKPVLETVEPPRSHRSYHSEGTHLERRSSKPSRPSTYYNVGSRGALPVPAKDDWS